MQEFSKTERETEVLRLVTQEAELPFDLAKGPLLRGTLLKLSQAEHVILFAIHHIVFDGWSAGLLTTEISTLYKAFCVRTSSLHSCSVSQTDATRSLLPQRGTPLPELPIQYADFAHAQRQWLQGEVLETLLSYWQKQLAGAPDSLNLQKIASKPSLSSGEDEATGQSFILTTDISAKLRTLSHQEGVTLFMILLAGFQTLLYRYTDQDDIVVGTDVANRNLAETELLIGFFVNLLVLRTDLSGNPTFRELLRRVREVALGAYAHQDLPFAKLVEVLQPNRTASHTPLFQVLFVLQNTPMPALEFSGLTLSPLKINTSKANFDLALFMEETEQGIVGTWKYNTDLFHPTAIARFSGHFKTLISSIVAQPDARLNTLEILTEIEKRQKFIEQEQREKASFKKFKSVKPQVVTLPQGQLIKTDYLKPGETLPLVIKPNIDEIDLAGWANNNRELIETNLLKHGAILFRGFNLNSIADFENLAQAICPDLFDEYGDLPRVGISGKVYGSILTARSSDSIP